MTLEAEDHLKYIKAQALDLIESKYRKGHQEHNVEKGEPPLSTLPKTILVDHAIEEAIDLVVYLLSLRMVLR